MSHRHKKSIIGKRVHLVIQHHKADRAGSHYDIRIKLPGERLYKSWAARYLPETPGRKVLATQQPDHTPYWATFSGRINSGYGKGVVTKIADVKDARILEASPTQITLMVPGKNRVPDLLTFIRTEANKWLIANHTTTKASSRHIPKGKPKYTSIPYAEVDLHDPSTVMTAKLDGAHGILYLRKGKRPQVFSYRESKRGEPLEYTYKLPPAFYTSRTNTLPKGVSSAVLRGEVVGYDKRSKKYIPARTVGKILNSGSRKALEYLQHSGLELRFAPFQVSRLGNRTLESAPYPVQRRILQEIHHIVPKTILPSAAHTSSAKYQLWKSIKQGTHPQTSEGVVLWSKEEGKHPTKAKILPEFDVYVQHIFKEKGSRNLAGGFAYSLTPEGPVVGKVGTGLSHTLKRDMLQHPDTYRGRVAKVRALWQFPSGSLRAPAFLEWHIDKTPVSKRETL